MAEDGVIFWDSSAIIKWYVDEEGSADVRKWQRQSKFHQAASISHAEVLAALQRLRRDNLITRQELEKCVDKFVSDFRRMFILDYSGPVRKVAEEISSTVGLRGADLVQLVSAIKLNREGIPIMLATFDGVLANAARDCGLRVLT